MFRCHFTIVVALAISVGIAGFFATARGQENAEIKSLILPGEVFLLENRPAFILWPNVSLRSSPQPWVFYAPTLAAYPDEHEKWMHQQFLDAGIAVAGIDVGEAYGSVSSRRLFDNFYVEMTEKRGFAKKPCLLGRSRGGLWVTSWACDHPDRFSGLAGIYPVFDFKTYPGLEPTAKAYGMTVAELEQKQSQYNPIVRMSVLAQSKLPALMIHGDEDVVVPLEANSQTFADTYEKFGAGSAIRLMVIKGQGHNYWEGFFRCRELIDFVTERAKSGSK